MPNRITLEDTALVALKKLSCGNPGAISVLGQWIANGPAIDPDACDPFIQMLSLDDMDIVGPDIWMLYKDVSGQDLRVFLGLLRAHQLGFLRFEDLKQAIRVGRSHALDVPALLSKVETELPAFRRGVSPSTEPKL